MEKEQVIAAGKRLFAALPQGKFSRDTFTALGQAVAAKGAWEDLPDDVKVAVLRVALAAGVVGAAPAPTRREGAHGDPKPLTEGVAASRPGPVAPDAVMAPGPTLGEASDDGDAGGAGEG